MEYPFRRTIFFYWHIDERRNKRSKFSKRHLYKVMLEFKSLQIEGERRDPE